MITVLESIKLSAQFLERKGIESARTNAELLLAHILGCKRLDLYLSFDRPLGENELKIYREYITKRSNFEPLQYLTGQVEFYGIEFKVNKDVLIPRPETEILVETILNYSDKNKESFILDIGCGSGIIGVTLAVNLPLSKIICTDVSDKALAVSKINSEKHNVAEKINFIKHNILTEDFKNFPNLDVIVSNPPYISRSDFSTLQNEIKNYEPRIAVTDEEDGITFFKEIIPKSAGKLKQGGKIFFEVGKGQAETVKGIMEKENFANIKFIKDYLNINRIVFGEIK